MFGYQKEYIEFIVLRVFFYGLFLGWSYFEDRDGCLFMDKVRSLHFFGLQNYMHVDFNLLIFLFSFAQRSFMS